MSGEIPRAGMSRFGTVAAAVAMLLAACERPVPTPRGSPNARPELIAMLRADRAAQRTSADRGGRAWIEGEAVARAGTAGRWTIVYEVGSEGIAPSGGVYLQIPPFWGWDLPQTQAAAARGFTRVTLHRDRDGAGEAEDPVVEELGQGLLRAHSPFGFAPGDRVTFEYGAGERGARADYYAERDSRFWIAVDGDGDGVRGVLDDSPTVDVGPGPARRVSIVIDSTAHPGESVEATIALLDEFANRAVDSQATIALRSDPAGWPVPERIEFAADDLGARTVALTAPDEGVWRIEATLIAAEPHVVRSNPLWVSDAGRRVLWADLHGHSGLSDGTGTPRDYLDYARYVAGLDIVALTDHDHYGMQPLATHPHLWASIREAVAAANDPPRFLALAGFEWTNWRFGHRHVLYFGEHAELHDSIAEEVDEPEELWRRLAGLAAMTIAHHSAGQPVAVDWNIAPDPVLEPLTEVVSVHGSSESADTPSRIGGFVKGNGVRDALDRGYRLGLIGSGDSHDGHPGLPHLNPMYGWRPDGPRGPERPGTGGLAAIVCETVEPDAVLAALRARATWATSGPRILLELTLDGTPQGATSQPRDDRGVLRLRASGSAPVARVCIVRSGQVDRVLERDPPTADLLIEHELTGLRSGEYVYVRVEQSDGALAWTSPIWIDGPAARSR